MDKLAAAKAFLGSRYCLAADQLRLDRQPPPAPPPVPLYLKPEPVVLWRRAG